MVDFYKRKLLLLQVVDELTRVANTSDLLRSHISKIVADNKVLVEDKQVVEALNNLSTKLSTMRVAYSNAWSAALALYDAHVKSEQEEFNKVSLDPATTKILDTCTVTTSK